MKYWFDTEFIEDGKTIDLISIGILAEDGREYYAELADVDWDKASDWIKENVLPWLRGGYLPAREEVAKQVREFCTEGGTHPEFWAYYADYDWVALCQLYGRMIDLPPEFPKYCMDLKQFLVMEGNPRIPDWPKGDEHFAMDDARWNKKVYDWLMGIPE